jgi:hypothetical protein
MSLIKFIADNQNPNSLASKFRNKRHNLFKRILADYNPIKILDIGGTQNYWKDYYDDIKNLEVTMVNLSEEKVTFPNLKSMIGDATNLFEIKDNEYDLIFSNSVIEHLFSKENQIKMAEEIKRVGKSYFIQTPNRFFPMEPHFLIPFYQFLPFSWQLFLLRNFSLGHVGKIQEKERAKVQINEIKLLSKNEFKELFSEATIYEEKFLFLTKSFVAYYKK